MRYEVLIEYKSNILIGNLHIGRLHVEIVDHSYIFACTTRVPANMSVHLSKTHAYLRGSKSTRFQPINPVRQK
jgi:hypothetical protein